jgi:hypothetical protein
VFRRSLVEIAQHVRVFVRHHRTFGVTGPDLLAADDDRDVDAFFRHLFQAGFQFGSRRCTGGVAEVWIVFGAWHAAAAGKYISHW